MVIRTVRTDVLALPVLVYEELKDGIEELWVNFGAGKDRKFVSIHEIFQRIGELKARGLPFFHTFTDCDQVLFLLSQATKHTTWKIWCLFDAILNVFSDLSHQPTLIQVQKAMPTVERFTELLYHHKSNCLNTNESRRELFCRWVLIISHKQVRISGNTLFDHITSQGMCGPSPWLRSKLYQHQRIGDGNSKIISWYLTGLIFLKQLLLWEISSNVLVIRKRVVEDDASVCSLSCFVQNFLFARDNVNGNRHDLICRCLKYTFWFVNYTFWSAYYIFWSVN